LVSYGYAVIKRLEIMEKLQRIYLRISGINILKFHGNRLQG